MNGRIMTEVVPYAQEEDGERGGVMVGEAASKEFGQNCNRPSA